MNGLLIYISIIPFPDDVLYTDAEAIDVYRSSSGVYTVCLKGYTYESESYEDFMAMILYIDKVKGIHVLDNYFDNYCGTKNSIK